MNTNDYSQLLKDSFKAVYQSVHPEACIKSFIPPQLSKGRLIVIGAGKASAAMAAAFEANYEGKVEGLVVTRYGHGAPTKQIKILEAAHPVLRHFWPITKWQIKRLNLR